AKNWAASSATNPGDWYEYNNGAFALLMLVMDSVLGSGGYVEYTRENVLIPLGIDEAFTSPTADTSQMFSSGSSLSPSDAFVVPATALGGWVISLRNLAKLPAALRGNFVIPKAEQTNMLDDRYRAISGSSSR